MRYFSSRLCLMMLVLMGGLTGAVSRVPSAQAATTAVVSGLQVVASPASAINSDSPKTAVAYCPSNKRVIGGGGVIEEISPITRKPVLTRLQPVQLYDRIRDAYVVTGAETPGGTTENWFVRAYAICANPLPGLSIVPASTAPSSSSKQATAASCSGGWVIGTGGRISTTSGHVALQVARPSGPGDIARVQAQEVPNGYTGTWAVTAYAVCVPTKPTGYTVVFAQSPQRFSESSKAATAYCPVGTQLLSSGAAITDVAPGHVALQSVLPYSSTDYRYTRARAVEHTATSADWDFIVATAICAS